MRHDSSAEVLQERGLEHERAYVDHLQSSGLRVLRLEAEDGSAVEATHAAMRSGADVIVQTTLERDRWHGRADILRRVPIPSMLGDWSYEVIDTKLARETKAGTILQLCPYSDIVGSIQGRLPEFMHVVSPGTDFTPETFRVEDYLAYYRLVSRQLVSAVDHPTVTYPEPVPHCDICRWWPVCDEQRRADDHLSLVAGVSRLQRTELADWGIGTLEGLARLPLPLEKRPRRGAKPTYVRIREQARVQLEARERGEPVYELLDRADPERGLHRLPEPSSGDIFFDIEGDPFVGTSGLEYLLGWAVLDQGGPSYSARWAETFAEECDNFEAFVDAVMERWEKHPDLHIYHYAPYEPAAIKRLMGRYATRENEVDRMLRGGLFVDLHSITKQSIRAGIERYSIKELEIFYGFSRDVPLREASESLHKVEHALELKRFDDVPSSVRATVEGYNRDDCLSTLALRDWLEGLRAERIAEGESIERPPARDSEPSENLSERQERIHALMSRLLTDVSADVESQTEEQHAHWLLAHLVDFHRREGKAPWWEKHRLAELGEEELLDDSAGVVDLEFVGKVVGGTNRCPVHRYHFPPQDTKLKSKGTVYNIDERKVGSVHAINLRSRFLDIKKRQDSVDFHPNTVYVHDIVSSREQEDALYRIGEWVVDNEIDTDGPYRAGRDLLLRRHPRLLVSGNGGEPLQRTGEPVLDSACRLGRELDGGVLPVQGPPGSGKTYTGAHMIVDFVRAGKNVGITAVSHKVIRNLLDAAMDLAREKGVAATAIQKVKEEARSEEGDPIQETTKNEPVVGALAAGIAQIGAGTAWMWSREEFFEAVDVLFVDEAGQMSLPSVVAVSQAAKSVVLLGDPQQLEHPLQGSHPEGTAVSALEHLLGEDVTIPPERGLFLPTTYRLHPSICELTSELFYEGRLRAQNGLDRQTIIGTRFAGSGLWFVPVPHEGSQSASLEEADRVVEIYEELLKGEWINHRGEQRPISGDDVLVVAPYNAHVGAISERLPDARVGTVDKFQGQEAPVVIYSMATSSPEDAPRGMEFLYSLNRLNVASSRARCACILVASPKLFEPECRTPRQMRLANAFCRYLEMARTVTL